MFVTNIPTANGNRYEGSWFEGQKYGKGAYYHLDSGQLQTGVWIDDIPHVSLMTDVIRNSAPEPTEHPIQEVIISQFIISLNNLFLINRRCIRSISFEHRIFKE